MTTTPLTWTVGRSTLAPYDLPLDHDPRGIIYLYEPPSTRHEYVIAVDPTTGLPGWHRALRTRDDVKTDNAAIEVLRCGNPCVQVAEYAAPIDPEELATYVNALGRIYSGSNEDGMAHCIIEVHPGLGLLTQRQLISHYGYTNMFVWRYEDSLLPKASTKLGWYSTRDSRKMLWIRGSRHIQQGRAKVHSQHLVEEMADCTPDNFLAATGRATGYGVHDDRVVAFLLGLWAANEWSMSLEPVEPQGVEDGNAKKADFQATDISADDIPDRWNERFEELLDGR